MAKNLQQLINDKWNLREKVYFNFEAIDRHLYNNLILSFKVVGVTVDNAANAKASIDHIPELEKVTCVCHTLNLVVKDVIEGRLFKV